MVNCSHCESEGRKVSLTKKRVLGDFALHLAKTQNLQLQDSYDLCPHCGIYHGATAADTEALQRRVAELEKQLAEKLAGKVPA